MKKSLPIIVIFAIITAGSVWYYFTTRLSSTTSDTGVTISQSNENTGTSTSPATTSTSTSSLITQAELTKNNGKNGKQCWVAVNGTVYDVTNADQWRNGQHIPSDGEAICGADMSSVIGKSPHGNKVLAELPIVGSLK